MKRNFTLCMVILMMLYICAGCGGSEEVSHERKLARAGGAEYDRSLITVGLIQTGKESDWREANTKDYMRTFTEEAGYNLIYADCNSNSERQLRVMYDMIAQKVDYIILNPIVETGWDDALRLAKDSGISVILADRHTDSDPSLYTCWIGSDTKEEGRNAARWLADYMAQNDRTSEDINIVLIEGTKGASTTNERTAGLKEQFDRHVNWHVVATECGNFNQGEGMLAMERVLQKQKDIDVVICENDDMMFGAMKAMNQEGISYGANGDVITISFDAVQEAFDLMQTGQLMASIECSPLLAEFAQQAIKNLEQGAEVKREYYAAEGLFSYEDAFLYADDRKY